MKCLDDVLSQVLVDTDLILNGMPKPALEKLPFEGASIRPSALMVKAFDGWRRTVIREIDLPMQIGLHVFQKTFQVMDINLAYSYLLGRPWIHVVGAVTTTLHQKWNMWSKINWLSFMVKKIWWLPIFLHSNNRSRWGSFGKLFPSSWKIANVVIVGEKDHVTKMISSFTSLKSEKLAVVRGNPEGWGQLINLREKKDCYRLGYMPPMERESWIPIKINILRIQ